MTETEAASRQCALERKSELERRVERKLLSGQRSLRRLRLGVGGVMVFIGLGSAVASLLLRQEWSKNPLYVIFALKILLAQLRYFALNLAPLADDAMFTRCILVMELVITLVIVVHNWFMWKRAGADWRTFVIEHHLQITFYSVNTIWVGGLAFGFIAAIVQRGVQRIQKFMWRALSLCLWLVVFSLTAAGLGLLTFGQLDHVGRPLGLMLLWILGVLLTIYLISRTDLRHAVHARLGTMFVAHSKARAAAGLACLLRGGSTREVLEEARRRFRVVSLASVALEDIETNRPDPSLFSKTMAAKLGHCDAFLSHSWHDNARAKWAALQLWREAFRRQHGREPCVWFDKFCIDQQDIDANLRSLPVYLSGCEKLIILYGPTYLERLWCVLEVFTFVHIGGSLDRVELLPVLRAGSADDGMADVDAAIQQFTVEDCTCFLEQDKECITTIILTAYGSLNAFSEAVRGIFSKTKMNQYSSDTDESATGEVALHVAPSGRSEAPDVARLDTSSSSDSN